MYLNIHLISYSFESSYFVLFLIITHQGNLLQRSAFWSLSWLYVIFYFYLYSSLSLLSYSRRQLPLYLNVRGNTGFSLRRSQMATVSRLIKIYLYLSSFSYVTQTFPSRRRSISSFFFISMKIFMKLSIIWYNLRHLVMIFSRCTSLGLLPGCSNSLNDSLIFSKKYIIFI